MKYLSFIFSSLYAVCATGTPGVSTEKLSTIFTSDPSKVSLVTSVTEDLVKTATLTNEGAKAYAEAQFFKKTGGDVSGNINIGSHALNANGIYVSSTSGDYLTFYRGPSASRPAVASVLHPDNSPIATSNMVEGIVSQHGGGGGGGGGPYLPLSGGTISGNLSVNGYLSLYSAGEFYDGLVLNYPPIISNGDGDTDYIDFIDDPGSTTSRLTIDGSPVATSNMVEGIISQHGGGGGGSEPSQYVKDATVSSGTLTLTKKSGSPVSVSASTLGALKSDGSIGMSGDIKLSGNKILLKNSTSYPYIVSDSTGGQMEFYSPNWYDFYRGTASPYETTYTSRLTPDGTPVQTRSSAMSLIKIATNMLAESLISGSGGFTTNIVTNIVTKSYVENLGISSDAYKIYSSNKTSGISGDGYIFTNAVKYTSSNQYFVLKQKTDHTGTYWFYDDGSSDWTLRYLGNNTWNLKSVRLSMGNTFNGGPNDTTLSCGAPLSTLTRSDDGVAKYADLVNSTRTINGKPLSSDIVIETCSPSTVTNITTYVVTNTAVLRTLFSDVTLLQETATTDQIIAKINEVITLLKTSSYTSYTRSLGIPEESGTNVFSGLTSSARSDAQNTVAGDNSGNAVYAELVKSTRTVNGYPLSSDIMIAGTPAVTVTNIAEYVVTNTAVLLEDFASVTLLADAATSAQIIAKVNEVITTLKVRPEPPEPDRDYLKFCCNNGWVSLYKMKSPNEIQLEYSYDKITWYEYTWDDKYYESTKGKFLHLNTKEGYATNVWFRAAAEGNSTLATSYEDYYYFVVSGTVYAYGNIMSLLDKTLERKDVPDYCFVRLFSPYWSDAIHVYSIPYLPATTLGKGCYARMFFKCDSITTMPDLPAAELAKGCYSDMFAGCSKLKTAKPLNAMKLAPDCYSSMFWGCSSLETFPTLPATKAEKHCYNGMFLGCTGLKQCPEIMLTTTAESCCSYMFRKCTGVTSLKNLTLYSEVVESMAYEYMFYQCSNTQLTDNFPAINAKTVKDFGMYSMFNGCSGLGYSTFPLQSVTTLGEHCYDDMFYGATKLNNCYMKTGCGYDPSVHGNLASDHTVTVIYK